MSETLQFKPDAPAEDQEPPWRILIADDEKEVHGVTSLALSGFRYRDRGLEFLHAYSGQEAQTMLQANPDIALVLLDVVMESDHAGLDVVQFVRNTLHNPFTRIVLRTGQPGQAPELDVITRYDINDYKYKTELTRERLFTTVYTSLSTYRDLMALDQNRRGLSKVIDASAEIFELHSLEQFAQGVLEQLTALLFLERDAVVVRISGIAAHGPGPALQIVAGTGAYEPLVGADAMTTLPQDIQDRIAMARKDCIPLYGSDYFVGCHSEEGDGQLVFYLGANRVLSKPDGQLIEKFCRNVAIAHRNLGKLNAARGRRNQDRP